ncbi:hypothetical protein AVEN_44584-1, partial [Araneus ventricosus]
MLSDRKPRLPLFFGRQRDTPPSPNENTNNFEACLESIQEPTIERIKVSRERMKIRFDSRISDHHFKEGNLVCLYNLKQRRGLNPNPQQNWEGPYIIAKKMNNVICRVQRVHVEPSANNILGLELVVEDVRYKDQGTFTCSAVVDGRETRIQFYLKVY